MWNLGFVCLPHKAIQMPLQDNRSLGHGQEQEIVEEIWNVQIFEGQILQDIESPRELIILYMPTKENIN